MMMLVWMLWALKLAGLSTMEYTTLWLITTVFLVVSALLRMGLKALQEKAVLKEMEACGDVKDEEAIITMLGLIFRKISIK